MAIKITVTKAGADHDLGASKFFGTPTVPVDWANTFDDDEIFFCQIRLEDIAHLDRENRLPHFGYLYVFLHTAGGDWDLTAHVRYCAEDPGMAIGDFNEAVEGYEQFNEAWLMEFSPAEEDADGIRLLGVPTDWGYEEEPPQLLLQFDPLDSEMGFLDSMDGYCYLCFGENPRDLSAITFQADYS